MSEPEESQDIIATFPKSASELVVAALQPYKGETLAHLRIFVHGVEDDQWIPTGKGVALPLGKVAQLATEVEKLRDVAATDKTVGRVPLGRDEVHVGTQTFRGSQYVFVRRFYKSGDEWQPTKKGVTVGAQYVDDLVELVRALADAAEAE